MSKKLAFTLLELMIAMIISSLIFIVLIRSIRQSIDILRFGSESSNIDRTVLLLFHQLDKDFSTAYIPYIYKIKDEKKIKEIEIEQKLLESPFIAKFKEDSFIKIEGKRVELLDNISFITTTPIEIYEKSKPRYARIKYELVINKKKSKGEQTVYDLWRKETEDLSNIKFEGRIYNYKVAENIKGLYLEYLSYEKEKKEKELKVEHKWDNPEKLPVAIKIYLTLWNSDITRHFMFENLVMLLTESKKPEPEQKIENQVASKPVIPATKS